MSRRADAVPVRSRVPFVALVVANLVSTIGGAMSLVALPWFVFAITGDAGLTGLAAFCEFAAVVVASTCAGWFIRHFGARGVRVLSDLVSGIAVLAIPALFALHALPFALVLVLVSVNGFLRTPAVAASYLLLSAAARRAGTTTDAVSGQYLASLQLAAAIGAPIAGVAISALGAPSVLAGDAVSFLISAALVQALLPRVSAAPSDEQRPSVLRALRTVWGSGLLRLMVAASMLVSVVESGWGTVIAPLYGTRVLRSAAALGLVLAAQGLGAVLGAWTAARIERRLRLRWLAPAAVALAVVPLFAAIAGTAPLALLAPAAGVCGIATGVFGTLLVNIEYATVPEDQQGHVFGVLTALGQSGSAIGPLLTGFVISASSLPAFAVAAIALAGPLALAMSFAAPLRGAYRTQPSSQR